jgi:hypothetical protein
MNYSSLLQTRPSTPDSFAQATIDGLSLPEFVSHRAISRRRLVLRGTILLATLPAILIPLVGTLSMPPAAQDINEENFRKIELLMTVQEVAKLFKTEYAIVENDGVPKVLGKLTGFEKGVFWELPARDRQRARVVAFRPDDPLTWARWRDPVRDREIGVAFCDGELLEVGVPWRVGSGLRVMKKVKYGF